MVPEMKYVQINNAQKCMSENLWAKFPLTTVTLALQGKNFLSQWFFLFYNWKQAQKIRKEKKERWKWIQKIEKSEDIGLFWNFDFCALLTKNVLICKYANGRKACYHVTNSILSTLQLIWLISRLKIPKLFQNVFLARIPWNQWVSTVYLRASGLDHYKVKFRIAGVAGQMFFIYMTCWTFMLIPLTDLTLKVLVLYFLKC